MRFSIVCLGCLGLIACADKDASDDGDSTASFTDVDGDGYGPGADCDDSDASVHPDADELCDGIDNNCDGAVDLDAVDAPTGYTDVDGDGYGDPDTAVTSCDITGLIEDGTDCDDSTADVSPGAAEVCDGVDNDCDSLIDSADDEVSGTSTFYFDSDGDGYGGEDTIAACNAPLGYVENSDDCDDSTASANPAWTEVGCDGIDNDCDGTIDLNTVPGAFGSIQEAVDGVDDGSEICLNAGTHAESVDVTGRLLTFTGSGDGTEAMLDVTGSAPFFVFDNRSGEEDGRIVLQNVSVMGDYAMSATADAPGALLHMVGGTASLRNIQVDDVTVSLDDTDATGGLVYGVDSTVGITNLSVSGLAFDVAGGNAGIAGGVVFGDASDLTLSEVVVDGTSVTTSVPANEALVVGLLAFATDSVLDISESALTGTSVDLAGEGVIGVGMAVATEGTLLTATELAVTDNTFVLEAGSAAMSWGMVSTEAGPDSGTAHLSLLDVSGNSVSLDGDNVSLSLGVVSSLGGDFTFEDSTVYNNTISAIDSVDGEAGATLGTVSVAGGGTLSHIDIRGNSLSAGDGMAMGGGLLVTAREEMVVSVTNVLVAGNTVQSATGDAVGAGFAVISDNEGLVDLTNVTAYRNDILGGEQVGGSGLFAAFGSGDLSVVNSDFGAGTATGTVVEGIGVHFQWDDESGESLLWTYNNVHTHGEDTGETNIFFGVDDPTDDEAGNISGDPMYSDDDADPTTWVFSVDRRSANYNAGDPAISDADGSRSDIGAVGGPGSDGW